MENKITREHLQGASIQSSPISPGNFTITIGVIGKGEFVLTSGDVVDAVKEYIIKYQKDLIKDGRYNE